MRKSRRRQIQIEADRVRALYGQRHWPVDVEQIAYAAGLRVEYDELPEGVSGLLFVHGHKRFIVVERMEAPRRQRFSIAHELGHYFIHNSGQHAHVGRPVAMARSLISKMGSAPEEREANVFAAELLMPSDLIRAYIEEKRWPWLDELCIPDLAEAFKVSEQAMAIRLGALELL